MSGAAPSQEIAPPGTLDVVRRAVRSVVEQNSSLGQDPALRKRIAEKMVRLSMAAAELIAEDQRITQEVAQRAPQAQAAAPVATAQDAGQHLGLNAVREAGRTVRNLREAIDFPTYVTSLISGVFQAITHSNMAQLESFVDLLEGVSASSDTFTAQNIGPDSAVRWALSRFDMITTQPGQDGRPQLVLRQGGEMPDAELLAATLEATEDEVSSIDEDDLTGTLLPLVRRKIGRTRQAMLATMVLMGMQRVVVDEGRIHASMDMRVDTTSAAEETERSQFDTRTNIAAQGTFGSGAWGASASASTTIGYVHNDDRYTREEISAQAGMRSSVDMTFRTEQIPLDQMANQAAIERIRTNSRVPEASWTQQQRLVSTERRTGTSGTLPAISAPPTTMPTPPPLPPPRTDGTTSTPPRTTTPPTTEAPRT
ncbi:hypothetical protein P2318_16595 [Myxococcaceae bacterium GXIMD 01537]